MLIGITIAIFTLAATLWLTIYAGRHDSPKAMVAAIIVGELGIVLSIIAIVIGMTV